MRRPILARLTDRSEVAVVLSRATTLLVGPVTVLSVGVLLTPTVQGFYYSFGSVLAASVFFEAGISTALVQLVSHETPDHNGTAANLYAAPKSSTRRLAALLKFSASWYLVIAALVLVGVGGAGWIIFSRTSDGVAWQWPWVVLVLLAAFKLALQPFLIFEEGLGRVAEVYRLRTLNALAQSLSLVGLMAAGLSLFALALSSVLPIILTAVYLWRSSRSYTFLLRRDSELAIDWRREILPFQWRIAVSWIAGYFGVSLFTPILLLTQGAIAAGQLGMSVTLFTACTSIAAGFIVAHAPAMGRLASRHEWHGLTELFRRKFWLSVSVAATMSAMVVAAAQLISSLGWPFAERLLPPVPFALLGIGFLIYHVEGVLAFFMRAQKTEPYFLLETIGALLILPLAYLLSLRSGVVGMVAAFPVVHFAVLLPIALVIFRRSLLATRRMPNLPPS